MKSNIFTNFDAIYCAALICFRSTPSGSTVALHTLYIYEKCASASRSLVKRIICEKQNVPNIASKIVEPWLKCR